MTVSARERFAKSLRELRFMRGYSTAREFAEALGINENTYTRYERAESEPNLEKIYGFLDLLRATPDELFGTTDPSRTMPAAQASSASLTAPGFEEVGARAASLASTVQGARQTAAAGAATRSIEVAAWHLARLLTEAGYRSGDAEPSAGPLASLKAATLLQHALTADPFGTIGRLAADEVLARAPQDIQARIGNEIDSFVASLAITVA